MAEEKSFDMNLEDLDKFCNRGLNQSEMSPEEFANSPFNDTCLEEFFAQLHASLRRYSKWEEHLYSTVYMIISIAAVIGNGLVVLVVLRKKSMRTNRNVLILNLALSNLILAIMVVPFLWVPSIDFEFPYDRFFCKFANLLPGSNIYCSTLTISLMAIDRYYSVKRLKLQSNSRQCMRAFSTSLIIWFISILLSIPLLIFYDTSMLYVIKDVYVSSSTTNDVKLRSFGWRQCSIAPRNGGPLAMEPQTIQMLLCCLQVTFLYIVPIFVLAVFNYKLTNFLRANASQMNRNRAPRPRILDINERKPEQNGLVAGLRSPSTPSMRSSGAERSADRRTSRTTSLLMAMAGSYAILWFPFTLISFLLDLDILYNEAHAAIIERLDQTCKLISMLSICVNPFLYGFLNTNFRHEFYEIYHTYIRCDGQKARNHRFTHDFSSVAINTRTNSVHHVDTDTSFVSKIRCSFRGGLAGRKHTTLQSTSPLVSGATVGNVSQTTMPSPKVLVDFMQDRICLDADSEHDSFV